MKTNRSGSRFRLAASVGAVLAITLGALLVPAGDLGADDRDLLRTSSGAPYVFVLFDATGSMVRIPANNSIVANNADDDPGSKMYQAKSALYSVIELTNGVNFGFATFPNQTRLGAIRKRCGGACICRDDDSNCGITSNGDQAGSLNFNFGDHCTNWETNSDTNSDKYGGYTYHWSNSTSGTGLQIGDIIPLDWGDDNVERIKERLAPNLVLGETTPDFGIARYFRDSYSGGESFLRLKSGVQGVFMSHGLTNLGTAVESFREWYDAWKPIAQANDPQFSCRKVFLLLMTDGFETCNNADAETEARQLLMNRGIQTYVVGFATNNPELNQIASAGGTQQAFFPTTQEELVDDFSEILIQVQNKARTFTSATVPSVVGRAGRQIFHTSFNPSQQKGLWPGRIDAFQRPVPLADINGAFLPDYRIACSGADDTACQIWDAGTVMLNQSPTQNDINSGMLKLGNLPNQRRVYYRDQDDERALFEPKSDTDDKLWLYGNPGFGFGTFISTSEAAQSAGIIQKTLVQKSTIIQNPFTGSDQNKTYVLGDIFHSDPVVVDVPKNFRYFAEGVVAREEFCGPRFDGVEDTHVPYPCFVQHQQGRRRVLMLGSNDGQLHAIDAGQSYLDSNHEIQYGVGTGRELFSYIPRAVLPTIRELAEDDDHRYSVDGSVTVDDAVIGEEWRTVVVGGLREGGRAYYALDITQPDTLDSDGLPTSTNYVPSCVDGGTGCAIEADLNELGPFQEAEYPSILWEFEENFDTTFATDGVDEDGNGKADLGDTWSKPNTGRILVCDTNCDPLDPDNDIETRYVAVFGGGMDPDFKRDPIDEGANPGSSSDDTWNPWGGNWLYMVDIGTGEILYKRKLDDVSGVTIGSEYPASTPSEPSAVDINQDSYLDTIYIGTTAGFLYKVNISSPQPILNTTVPDYSRNVTGAPRASGESPLMMSVDRITDADWEPFQIFDTGGRPIYYPPSVIFVASLGQYALGFGTGDREDLWSETTQEGRYYLFLDTGFTPSSTSIPLTESVLEAISPELSESPNTAEDFLLAPDADNGKVPGWVMTFEPEERVLDRSFALSGVLFLTTFTPNLGIAAPGQCSTTGTSRVFTLFVNNANAVGEDRYIGVPDLVTRPWVEPGETYDTLPAGNPPPPPAEGICDAEDLQAITQTLKDTIFPPACDFANYTLNIMTIRSETGVECVAPVPLCIIRRNWKEF